MPQGHCAYAKPLFMSANTYRFRTYIRKSKIHCQSIWAAKYLTDIHMQCGQDQKSDAILKKPSICIFAEPSACNILIKVPLLLKNGELRKMHSLV